MPRSLPFLLPHALLASLLVAPAAATIWTQAADMPRFRQEHSAVSIDDRYLYLVGGIEVNFEPVPQIDRFDTLTGTWLPNYASLPAGRERHHFNAVTHAGEVYLVGGKTFGDTTGKTWVDKWDPLTDEWTVLPDLPQPQWGGPTIINEHRLHLVGGATGRFDTTNHHYTLDLNDQASGWSRLSDIPRPSVHAAGFALDDHVYVITGETNHSHPSDPEPPFVYEYTPETDEWTRAADFPIARNHAEWSTFAYAGRAYSLGGNDNNQVPRGQDSIYVSVDPAAEVAWTQPLPSLPKPLIGPSAVVVDERLWVMGGWDSDWDPEDRVRDTWVLDLGELTSGDFNDDGTVDLLDYPVWSASLGAIGSSLPADGNSDGVIDTADYTVWRDRNTSGDFNTDGLVDLLDHSVWSASHGAVGPSLPADGNRDGVVNAADYTVWRDMASAMPGLVEPVPAPGALTSALGLAFVAMAFKRTR